MQFELDEDRALLKSSTRELLEKEAALGTWEEAMEVDPRASEIRFTLAERYEEMREPEPARRHYAALCELTGASAALLVAEDLAVWSPSTSVVALAAPANDDALAIGFSFPHKMALRHQPVSRGIAQSAMSQQHDGQSPIQR